MTLILVREISERFVLKCSQMYKPLLCFLAQNHNRITTYYYYDFSGALTGEYRQTNGGYLSYFLSYDEDGNKVEKTSINGQTKTITTGTDENGKSYVSNDGVTADYYNVAPIGKVL